MAIGVHLLLAAVGLAVFLAVLVGLGTAFLGLAVALVVGGVVDIALELALQRIIGPTVRWQEEKKTKKTKKKKKKKKKRPGRVWANEAGEGFGTADIGRTAA